MSTPHPPTLPFLSLPQVVDHERPDLQEHATALVRQLAEYTITLKDLENNLLARWVADVCAGGVGWGSGVWWVGSVTKGLVGQVWLGCWWHAA